MCLALEASFLPLASSGTKLKLAHYAPGCIAPWLCLTVPVTAFPRDTQNGSLPLQPALTETEPTSNVIFGQISPPAPGTCQDLLYTVSSLALLSEYLSLLAVRVTLEDIGCPTEAHYLQLQLSRV
ncbi:apolipoprotein N [Cricetulus griseus]